MFNTLSADDITDATQGLNYAKSSPGMAFQVWTDDVRTTYNYDLTGTLLLTTYYVYERRTDDVPYGRSRLVLTLEPRVVVPRSTRTPYLTNLTYLLPFTTG